MVLGLTRSSGCSLEAGAKSGSIRRDHLNLFFWGYSVSTSLLERSLKVALLASASAAILSSQALAQDAPAPAPTPAETVGEEEVVVTGSRIQRRDFVATSPIATVTGEQAVQNADITLDTYLNTLPQANPAGTSTSNNPGNGGQSNINLRGLGSNRNLVLVDGRRPMVSGTDQTVDLNTIPAALIERIEVITGGAGATYGADALAGVVNIILKKDFEGIDFRSNYTNTSNWDGEEYSFSGVVGGNFADGKGNAVISLDRSYREALTKGQREFARYATSTTGTNPTGGFIHQSTNPIPQAAVDALFGQASYGSVAAGGALNNLLGFNTDGSLFSRGIFNSPIDVQNFRYAVNSPAAPNIRFFPDFYSYNFDEVNLLVLPFERKSLAGKANYEIAPGIDVWTQLTWTENKVAAGALAPTPISPTVYAPGTAPSGLFATSSLVVAGGNNRASGLIVPVTNPFIPADLATLLAARVGDNPRLAGAGATEAFAINWRSLPLGLRQSNTEQTVVQYMVGIDAELGAGWSAHAYASEGTTEIDTLSTGNFDITRGLQLLAAADGGASICAGGFNPFGINGLSDECIDYLQVDASTSTEFTQQIFQAYATGPIATLEAGDVELVIGGEHRYFEYNFNPGGLNSPVAGFNTANAAAGTNSFTDFFSELLIPVVADAEWAKRFEISLGYRYSESQFIDEENGITGDTRSDSAYKADILWEVNDIALVRASYQRAVRAPNFNELFSGGSSFPQFFDPCSLGTNARNTGGAAFDALCIATGVANYASFVASPGGQFPLSTSGNTDLKPETADTWTFGVALSSPWEDDPIFGNARMSIDYYNIKIEDVIATPDPNLFVAECYNYFGTNPTFDPNTLACQAVAESRAGGGGQLLGQLANPLDPDGNFAGVNQGYVKTSGIDVQYQMGFDLEALGAGADSGSIALNILLNYLISYEVQERPGIPAIEYAGTVSYFGQGLGSSFPEFKVTTNIAYTIGDFTFDTRIRYIDAMSNRAGAQFEGESFGGVPATYYIDLAAEYQLLENVGLRIGVNNVTDQDPRTYSPNVQSGTDPSTYDIYGRRYFAQTKIRF